MTSIDLDLIRKYDKPGPRYTSYPTAPLFSEEIGAQAFRSELERTYDKTNGLSLYVHVPYCHKLCWFCGCNMLVSRQPTERADHVDILIREIRQMAGAINPLRRAEQIHFGGGTPTYLTPTQLTDIVTALKNTYPFADDAEVSIEIDPRQLSDEHVDTIFDLGFNRVSMGVQDFNPAVQKAINRDQPYDLVRDRVDSLRRYPFDSINMDLIYGLPLQTLSTFERTLDQIIELSPDRIALFNYAHVPWLKSHQKLIRTEDLPAPEDKLEILKLSVERLADAGYVFIGMDHFAKANDTMVKAFKDDSLHRNFQGYTTKVGLEMLAFGMSAISMLDRMYVQNVHAVSDYETQIQNGDWAAWRGVRLSDDDVFRRNLIQHLMCRFTIDIPAIEQEGSKAFDDLFPGARLELDDMAQDGLLRKRVDGYTVTAMGRLLIRNIAMVFDAYLQEMREKNKARFSRTV